MKILLCIDGLSKNGASRVLLNIAEYLSKENEVIFTCTVSNIIEYKVPRQIRMVNTYSLRKGKIIRNITRINNLNKLIKMEKPDIVLSFLPRSSFMCAFLKRKKNKLVISVRNDPKIEYNGFAYHLLAKILYPRADGFVFQTEDAKNYFSKKIQRKSRVIFNSLNPSFIVKEPFLGKRKKCIVAVGRLEKQKNHKLLIDAFSIVHDSFNDYNLIIYGDGSLRNTLTNYSKELGLDNVIKFPGIVDNIIDQIFDASLFVLSSNYEGLPNSLIESMALGIPSISTDCPCGGPKLLIDNYQNGILVETGNAEELAFAIKRILEDKELSKKISMNAIKISNKLNPSKINKEWKDYLYEVVDK